MIDQVPPAPPYETSSDIAVLLRVLKIDGVKLLAGILSELTIDVKQYGRISIEIGEGRAILIKKETCFSIKHAK